MAPQWKIEQERHRADRETRRQENFKAHRRCHSQRAHEVAADNVKDLAAPADVYLGRKWSRWFDGSEPPDARVRGFLGDKLGDQALMGFIAVLDRSDLPSAADIAKTHCEYKQFVAETAMICGIAEMLRQGRPINAIDRSKLAAVYMACRSRQTQPGDLRSTAKRERAPLSLPRERAIRLTGEGTLSQASSQGR